jgi:hypothetical protein
MTNNTRASGKTAAEETARDLGAELDKPIEPELPDERKRKFATAGQSRMRVDWRPEQRSELNQMHLVVQRRLTDNFADAFALLVELWSLVREPVRVDGEVLRDKMTGMPEWRRTPSGGYIEDWGKLNVRERERFLYQLTTRLAIWEQRATEAWYESMYAKVTWEMSFSDGFERLEGTMKDTVEARTARGKLVAREDHFFAILSTYYSRKAEALVRSMERIAQRLKDIHVG